MPPCPPVGHYERWLLSRAADDLAYKLWAQSLGPEVNAAQTWYSALPAAWHSSTWIADRAIAYLSRHAPSRPFCLWVSFPDPHHPFDCPEPWSRLYDPDDMVLPKHRVKDLERRPWWHKAALESTPQLADPEMMNRFDDPAYAKTRKVLDDMMRARPGKILERLPEPVGMT